MRRAAQPRGARRADRVLRWADRVPRGDRGHLAAQHCADVHGAPDSGGDAVRHLRAPQEGRRGAAPDLHRPDRGGRRVRAAGLRRLPARPKVPGDRGDLGERLGAVYPVFGFPARAAPDHLHHQRRGEPELPAPEDHQEPGALPQRRRRDQAAVAGHPRHRRQTRPPTGQGERPATDPAHRARSAGRRRHRAGLESRPRRAGFGLPRPARRLPHLTPFLRHGHSFPPRRRSPRGAPAAQRGRTTWTPTSGGRRSTAEEISTADRFTYTDILTSSADGTDGRWRIARKVAPERVISTVDPEARHAHKTRAHHQDGYKAHVKVEPDTGLITGCALTPASGPEYSDAAVGIALLAEEPDPIEVLGDSAYGTGELLAAVAECGHTAIIKPWPLRPAVEGGFTLDEFTV